MTTNSPNPVYGDVQALIGNIQRRIKNTKRWLSANKSIGNPESEAVELLLIYETALAALTAPPAQLLRPVELPDCVDDLHGFGPVMSADAVVEALRQQGYEVKND